MPSRIRTAIATIASGSVLVMLAPAPAQAQYLDPGAGSVIVQVVIAVMVGASAVLKLYWGKISGFLGRRSKIKSQL